MDEGDVLADNRGGEKGTSRKYAPETKQQIIRIKEDLETEVETEDSYFLCSEVVKKNYENQTGEEEKRTEQVHEIPGI